MSDSRFADVSSNNGPVNVPAYASAGHVALAVKATEDTGYVNPFHAGQVASAHDHGLCVIHYHFARPENGNPVGQADHFWETIRGNARKPGDFVAVDVETGSPSAARGWTQEFDARLRAISPFHPWLYTYLSFLESGGLTIGSRRIWLAAWGSRRPGNSRWNLANGQHLIAWQYTDGVSGPGPHTFAGISGTSDGSLMDPALARAIFKGRKHR